MGSAHMFCFFYVGTQLYLGIIEHGSLEEVSGGGYAWQNRAIKVLFPKLVFVNTVIDQHNGSVQGHQVTIMPLNPLQIKQNSAYVKINMLHTICDVDADSNNHFTCSDDVPPQENKVFHQYWNTVIAWENQISGNPISVPTHEESKKFS